MRVIPNHKDYSITTHGDVISYKGRTPRLIRSWDNDGYDRVKIDGVKYLAHRLVAECYISNPNNLPQVHHKDHNRRNNHYTNLEWITLEDNTREGKLIYRWHISDNHTNSVIEVVNLKEWCNTNNLNYECIRIGSLHKGRYKLLKRESHSSIQV